MRIDLSANHAGERESPAPGFNDHRLDACISCYFQSFELAGPMGYFLVLRDTAQYYDAVMQVAARSLERIGNPVGWVRLFGYDLDGQATRARGRATLTPVLAGRLRR